MFVFGIVLMILLLLLGFVFVIIVLAMVVATIIGLFMGFKEVLRKEEDEV